MEHKPHAGDEEVGLRRDFSNTRTSSSEALVAAPVAETPSCRGKSPITKRRRGRLSFNAQGLIKVEANKSHSDFTERKKRTMGIMIYLLEDTRASLSRSALLSAMQRGERPVIVRTVTNSQRAFVSPLMHCSDFVCRATRRLHSAPNRYRLKKHLEERS